MWRLLHSLRLVVLVCGLLLVACGAPTSARQSAASNGTLDTVAQDTLSTEVQGTLRLNGSSALLPLMQLATDVFQSTHSNVHFVVAGSRSSAGRQLVCAGSIDIGTSDVPLTADEKAKWNCADALEVPIALQAFVPVANPRGPGAITSLTKTQLVALFSGAITNWKDIGGDDQPIVLVNRVAGSGTRANMAKYLFGGDDRRFAPSAAEGENGEVAQAARDTPGAVPYLGPAYLGGADMRVFAIEGVLATRSTIQSGAWPITAQGYVITKGQGSASVQAFLTFLTSSSFQQSDAFAQLGYVPISD